MFRTALLVLFGGTVIFAQGGGQTAQSREAFTLALTGDSIITHAEPQDMSNPHKSVCELVKYSLKFSDLTIPDTVEAYQLLRGKKLMECSGALRGVELPEDDALLDDLLTGQYREFLYRWHGEAYTLVGASCQPERILIDSPHGVSGEFYGEHAHSVLEGEPHPRGLFAAEGPS